MTLSQAGRTMVLILSLAAVPAFATRTHRASSSRTHASLKHIFSSRHLGHSRRARAVVKPKGQRQIAPERATEIQAALIHQNYMTGTPTGQWDSDTETAMQKYQADHGWQTKLTPDSRALINLGLGPIQGAATQPNTQTARGSAPATSEAGTLAAAHATRQ